MARVSVVIPARNCERTLRRAVASVQSQVGARIERIVIAVGPSGDSTHELAHQLADADRRIVVISNPTGRTPTALNRAARAAEGDVVVRVDAQAVLPSNYVAHALQTLEVTGAANVGAIQSPVGATLVERAIAAAMRSPLGSGGARYRSSTEREAVETAYLGVFRREAIDEVGGFDERFTRNQDSELNIRLQAAGHEVWLDPRLVVEYRPRSSLRKLANQYWQYGWWRAQTIRKHARSLRLRQAVVPVVVGGVTVALLFAALVDPIWLAFPLMYAVTVVGQTMFGGRCLSPSERVVMMCALPVMHFSWGFGLIVSFAGSLLRLTGFERVVSPPQ